MDLITLAAAKKSSGGGGSGGLPPVTASDNGKVLTAADGAWAKGVQEYWIPITVSGSEFSIPNDKLHEVTIALNNADKYWVRGVDIGNYYYPGYASNRGDFIVPLSKSFMQEIGFDCAGKIHIVEGDPYTVSVEPDKFIVTLTPTAQDYSGTMDKTVAEINAAYEAGQDVWFSTGTAGASFMFPLSTVVSTSNDYPSFQWTFLFVDSNYLVQFYIGSTSDGTTQTYSTKIYTLTPAT